MVQPRFRRGRHRWDSFARFLDSRCLEAAALVFRHKHLNPALHAASRRRATAYAGSFRHNRRSAPTRRQTSGIPTAFTIGVGDQSVIVDHAGHDVGRDCPGRAYRSAPETGNRPLTFEPSYEEIGPQALDLDVGFVDPPGAPSSEHETVPRFSNSGTERPIPRMIVVRAR